MKNKNLLTWTEQDARRARKMGWELNHISLFNHQRQFYWISSFDDEDFLKSNMEAAIEVASQCYWEFPRLKDVKTVTCRKAILLCTLGTNSGTI